MPCEDDEEEMNAPDENQPFTPVKVTGNGGAGRVDPAIENDSDLDDSDQEEVRKWNGRKWNGRKWKWNGRNEEEMERQGAIYVNEEVGPWGRGRDGVRRY